MKKLFNENIASVIKNNPAAKFIVSLSGGVDSMVALHLLKNFSDTVTPIEFSAIHVNHNIDKEDDDWQSFCQNECKRIDVNLIIENVFLRGLAAIDGEARIKRYKVIAKHTDSNTYVITGHHANDSAESLLMALQHGTGLDGLCGIRDIRPMQYSDALVFRPLLPFTKNDIIEYAINKHISWVEDPSNSKPIYLRNKIRITVLPQLVKGGGEGVIHRINNTAKICQNTLKAMNELIEMNLKNNSEWDKDHPWSLPVSALVSETLAPFVIRHWMKLNGMVLLPSSALINNMVKQVYIDFKPHNKPVIMISGGIEIKRIGTKLHFSRNKTK
ncbi:tRNA lysidine(34) synthetase TilS [Photobacterium damselae]|uniref:tRNA lysidine(34) synthetase TilS n=1 Tax=Photobacterium damselae TaxID=38293 RepID=UPI004068A8A4